VVYSEGETADEIEFNFCSLKEITGHDQRERIIQESDQLLYTMQIEYAHQLCSSIRWARCN
jgi:hypothetical protein